jgi:hypothetical protein
MSRRLYLSAFLGLALGTVGCEHYCRNHYPCPGPAPVAAAPCCAPAPACCTPVPTAPLVPTCPPGCAPIAHSSPATSWSNPAGTGP